jgi:GT2 family glycosyltransferase
VSIIIVTFNNLALSRLCLESLLRSTDYSNYEVIVVDNNSSDETRSFLTEISGLEKNLKIILNDVNYGFAKANNQGLEISSGDYLVLLNNDTIVPPGWLSRLIRHLQDPQVGMVGPLTNFVGNESKIKATYRTWAEMEEFSQNLIWVNDLKIADIHMLAMFCVAMRRDVFEQAGPLDEQFGIGMFEDDDYSLRIKRLGYRLICAADCFVHHFGQAAFGKLINEGRYDNLFNENRARFENKWQLKWTPHQNVNLEFNQHDIPRPPTLNSGP